MERRRYIAPNFPHLHMNIKEKEVLSGETSGHKCFKSHRDLGPPTGYNNQKESTMKEMCSIDNSALIDSAAVRGSAGMEECSKPDDVSFSRFFPVCNDSLQSGESAWRLHDASRMSPLSSDVKPQLGSSILEFPRTIKRQHHSRYEKMDVSRNFPLLSPIPSCLPAALSSPRCPSHAFQTPKGHETDGAQIQTEAKNDDGQYKEEIADGSSSGAPEACVVGMTSQASAGTALRFQHCMHSLSDTDVESDHLRISVQLELDRILPQTVEAEKTEIAGVHSSLCKEVESDRGCNARAGTDFDRFKATVDDVFSVSDKSYAKNIGSEVKLTDEFLPCQVNQRERGKILQEALAELPVYPRLAIYDRTHCPFRSTEGNSFTDAFHDRVQQELTNRVLYSTTIHQGIIQQWEQTNYEPSENGALESNSESSPVITATPAARIRKWPRQLLLEGTVDYIQIGRHLLLKSSRKAKAHFHDRIQGAGGVVKSATSSVMDQNSVKKPAVEQKLVTASENQSSHLTVLSLLDGKRKQYDATHARIVSLVVDACQSERNARADSEADKVKKCEESARNARQLLYRVLRFHEQVKDSQRPQQDRDRTKRRRRLL